jgi:hypothetical protein
MELATVREVRDHVPVPRMAARHLGERECFNFLPVAQEPSEVFDVTVGLAWTHYGCIEHG